MASRIDNLAEWLSGERLEGSSLNAATTTITGEAVSNSNNGVVRVIISDDTTQGDTEAGTTVEIPTTTNVKDGDEVIITNIGTDTLRKPIVTGVVGRGDEMAKQIDGTAGSVAAAETAAVEAAVAAEAVSQHFFADDNGVHVTTEEGDATAGHNLLANSEGILMRDGETWLTAQTPGGFAVYDGDGNKSKNILTNISKSGITLGSINEPHADIGSGGLSLRLGEWETIGDFAPVFNSGACIFYAGTISEMPGPGSNSGELEPAIAFGNSELGIIGDHGKYSASLGDFANASGYSSFACGSSTNADGFCSFAEGEWTTASGAHSHAGGAYSKAIGTCSFVHGNRSKASHEYQAAFGQYNLDEEDALFEIGNGTRDDKRSNAFSVSNDGDIAASGDITTAGNIVAAGGIAGASATITGTVSGGSVSATNNITAGGNITATGTVKGGTLTSTGAVSGASVSATGAVSGNTVSSTGNITCGGSLTTKGMTSNGAVSVTGNISSTANITATTQVTAAGVRLAPVVLFNSDAGSTSDSITLSDTVANYKYIEILYQDTWNGAFNSVKIKSPGTGTSIVDLSTQTAWMQAQIICEKQVNVSGKTITAKKDANGEPWAGQLILRTSNSHTKNVGTGYIKIHQVLGY